MADTRAHPAEEDVTAVWREYLTTGVSESEERLRGLFRRIPGSPRCGTCYAPLSGVGGSFVRIVYGKRPSNLNPNLCNVCEEFGRAHPGGAEIELTLLFADVRGSTALAESMSPTEYGRTIGRLYGVAAHVMAEGNALVDKIIGDQVSGMFVPGLAGTEHAGTAIAAARELLRATGHDAPEGPWAPLGVGVHTGIAYVGAMVSEEGLVDITALGDAANTAARLSSHAGVGEILASEAACRAAGIVTSDLPMHELELKGKTRPVTAFVLGGGRSARRPG